MKPHLFLIFLCALLAIVGAVVIPGEAQSLETRGRKASGRQRPSERLPKTPRPKPQRRPKPTKPKATPKKKTPTKTKSAKTSTTPQPKKQRKSKTCKQIAQPRLNEELAVSKAKQPRSDVSVLEKRARKGDDSDGPCGLGNQFRSGIYEPSGNEMRQNPMAPIWGWKMLDMCENLAWYKGVTGPAYKQLIRGQKYQTEHVLEWQNIEEFFGEYLKTHFKGKKFKNPDPQEEQKELDWCDAWKSAWTFSARDAFALKEGDPKKTPFDWIADVYPNKNAYRDEFTILQAGINGIKGRLFKTGDRVFTDEDKSAAKKGEEPKKGMMTLVAQEPRLALARLKDVVGARKYLGDPEIRKFMRDVKNRLEERFDKLEEALADPGNTRKIVPTRTRGGSTRTFNPWEKQDLGKLWDTYMNNKWADMQQKMDKFMEKYLMKIKLAHCTAKKIKALPKDKTKDTPAQQMTRDACPVYNAVVRGWKDAQRANFGVPWSGAFISGHISH